MADGGSWQILPLSPVALLSSIQTGKNEYTVRITDTANLWIESLDYKAIRGRGLIENTSIDPSDSPENMAKLLSCLQAALEPSHNDHPQTSMTLSPASPNDAGEDGLTITITCSLPGLQPLEWPIHLYKASSSSISSALVLPFIHGQHSRAREIESLAAIIAQKDAVLTKLLDKLEATGTGLEHTFNQLSGKKKISRSAASDKIKGLAPFDRQQWQHDVDQQERPSSTEALIREVFKGDGMQQTGPSGNKHSPELDRWWLDLKGSLQTRQLPSNHSPLPQSTPKEKAVDDDDDFQMQETPSHLASRSKPKETRVTEVIDDASTASDDDDELTASQPAKPAAKAASKPSMGRMGAVGGRKPSPPKPSPSPVPATSTGNVADDDETASEADSPPPPSPPKRSAAPKAKMGQVGGKASKGGDGPNEEASSRPPKLGTVGGGQASKANDEARGRQSTQEKAEAKPRETSTERADRRREEIKKELERKAAAGPAKKKRKL